jgi:hypothetical protein
MGSNKVSDIIFGVKWKNISPNAALPMHRAQPIGSQAGEACTLELLFLQLLGVSKIPTTIRLENLFNLKR